MTNEKSLWDMSDEEADEYMKPIRARLRLENERPEVKTRLKREKGMRELIATMVYPLLPTLPALDENHAHPSNGSRKVVKVSMGKKRTASDEEMRRHSLESDKQQRAELNLAFALERIDRTRFNKNGGEESQSFPDVLHREMMESRIEAAYTDSRWQFKVGASLYVLEQMHNRYHSPSPSLNKAQWLLCNMPTDPASTLLKPRGDPRKIGGQWRFYHLVSDLWAAFVVWHGSLLNYELGDLVRFYLEGDPEYIYRLARYFNDFRCQLKRVEGPISYLQRGQSMCCLYNYEPVQSDEIPALLSANQLSCLQNYQIPP
jgi:hypothetical protein